MNFPAPTEHDPSDVGVVIAAHTEDRWDTLVRAVDSVRLQQPPARQIVVSIDNNPALADRVRRDLPGVDVVLNTGSRGAGSTRNAGAAVIEAELLVFLDDDAVAEAGWLAAIIAPLSDPEVAGVGGFVSPDWEGEESRWMPPEFYWVIGATYRGMPENGGPVRNVWAENMAVRRRDFEAVGGFREGYGKRGKISQPEDTDLCIRMSEDQDGRRWYFAPEARVRHHVPVNRSTRAFFLRRSYNEGRAKARMSSLLHSERRADDGLGEERRQAAAVIPSGIVRNVAAALGGDLAAAERAAALASGLAVAGAGFVRERLSDVIAPGAASEVAPDVAETVGDRDGLRFGEDARVLLGSLDGRWRSVEVDLVDGLPVVGTEPDVVGVFVVVRVCSLPVGTTWIRVPSGGLPVAELGRVVDLSCGGRVREALAEIGSPVDPGEALPVDGVPVRRTPSWIAHRERLATGGPSVTAVVCTRGRTEGLRRTLESLQRQEYPRLRVLVVDNAPEDDHNRVLVSGFDSAPVPVDYTCEPVPGLSRARNRAMDECRTELIAFLDDDEEPDAHWIGEIVRAFDRGPEVACVTGLMLPADLDTRAKQYFELWGGHTKGLAFEELVHDGTTMPRSRILYPLPAFGAGGNMAFRLDALRRFGRFDTALGAGTPVKGAEDTDAFSGILLDGGTLVMTPTSITFHHHRDTMDALTAQMRGYGAGLTAWYLALLLRDPLLLRHLLPLVPKGLAEVLGSSGLRSEGHGDSFPKEVLRANRRGMLAGPGMYLLTRWRDRRVSAS